MSTTQDASGTKTDGQAPPAKGRFSFLKQLFRTKGKKSKNSNAPAQRQQQDSKSRLSTQAQSRKTAANVGKPDPKTWGTTPIPGEPGYQEEQISAEPAPRMGGANDVEQVEDESRMPPRANSGFLGRVNNRGKNAYSSFRTKLSSKSRPEDVPKTFEEYRKEYQRGNIDVDDPPEPQYGPGEEPVPFFAPAHPENERERQLEVNRYEAQSLQLQDNEQFARIVSLARSVFNTKVSMVTIMDNDKQLFLAEVGMGGMKEVDRDVTFCAHTILNENNGFCVLDTTRDFRFKNNPLVAGPAHARFYAGMPIFSPNGLPMGTLCVVDDTPRERFTLAERKRLAEFSELVSGEIERYHNIRQQQKMETMNQSMEQFKSKIRSESSLGGPKSISRSNLSQKGQDHAASELPPALPSKDPQDMARHGRVLNRMRSSKPSSQVSIPRAGMTPRDEQDRMFGLPPDAPLAKQLAAVELPSRQGANVEESEKQLRDRILASEGSGATTGRGPQGTVAASGNPGEEEKARLLSRTPAAAASEDGTTTAAKTRQDVWFKGNSSPFDLATSLIAQTLGLDLVYLLAVEPDTKAVRLVSANGLPDPPPLFDPTLHIKALRAKHGLLYQNPRADEMLMGETLPNPETYASGMLVGVIEYAGPPRVGYVLAGFTTDPRRVFGSEDLRYLQQFSASLIQFIAKESKRLAKEQKKAGKIASVPTVMPSADEIAAAQVGGIAVK